MLNAALLRAVSLRGDIGWVVGGQLLAFAGLFAVVKLLTGVLGPEGYGEVAIGVTVAGTIHAFIYGPIEQTLLRYAPQYKERKELPQALGGLKWVHSRAAFVLVVIGLAAGFMVGFAGGPTWGAVVFFGFLYGIVAGSNASVTSILNGLLERRTVAIHQGVGPWLRLLAAVSVVVLLGPRSAAVLLAFAVGELAVYVSQTWSLRTFVTADNRKVASLAWPSKPLSDHLSTYGLPFVLFAALAVATSYADRWLLLGVMGAASVGIYVALYQVANAPISMIAGIANQLMVPIIFNRAGTLDPASSSDAHRLISILTGIYVVVSIAFVIIAYWFGIDIMRLLTTAEMAAYGGYLWIIVAGLAISNLGQVGVLRGLSEGDSARYSWPKAIQAGTLIALIVPMVHRFGFPGIAWSLFASSVAYIFSVVTVNRRKSRIRRVRYG